MNKRGIVKIENCLYKWRNKSGGCGGTGVSELTLTLPYEKWYRKIFLKAYVALNVSEYVILR